MFIPRSTGTFDDQSIESGCYPSASAHENTRLSPGVFAGEKGKRTSSRPKPRAYSRTPKTYRKYLPDDSNTILHLAQASPSVMDHLGNYDQKVGIFAQSSDGDDMYSNELTQYSWGQVTSGPEPGTSSSPNSGYSNSQESEDGIPRITGEQSPSSDISMTRASKPASTISSFASRSTPTRTWTEPGQSSSSSSQLSLTLSTSLLSISTSSPPSAVSSPTSPASLNPGPPLCDFSVHVQNAPMSLGIVLAISIGASFFTFLLLFVLVVLIPRILRWYRASKSCDDPGGPVGDYPTNAALPKEKIPNSPMLLNCSEVPFDQISDVDTAATLTYSKSESESECTITQYPYSESQTSPTRSQKVTSSPKLLSPLPRFPLPLKMSKKITRDGIDRYRDERWKLDRAKPMTSC